MQSVDDVSTLARRVPVLRELCSRMPILEQFMKFGVVGVLNTLLTFIAFTILTKGFGVWYVAASAVGFAVGAGNGFLLNRRWTFRDHRGGALAAVRWTIVQGCGLGLDLAIIYLCVHYGKLPALPGQAVAILFVTTSTFFVNRRWTFRMHLDERDADAPGAELSEQGAPGERAVARERLHAPLAP
ncbi:MAG: GtrA family protein [Solirubrobacteraceae bacterium]